MSSLPLEVHEVLEQEYVSMHGTLDGMPGAAYAGPDILDEAWARRILTDCGIDAREGVLATLNKLVAGGEGLQRLCQSPAITENGKALLGAYADYTNGVSKERKEEINRRIVDAAFCGAVRQLRDVRLGFLYGKLHGRPDGDARTALCISGGGIRSATFALGVIQGLASAGILDKFDYLSTVSGGGYIGSWLSSWVRRHAKGIGGVQSDLARADAAVAGTQDGDKKTNKKETPESKIDPEPQPMRHLREYSNYLSPRLGLASADTWTMASLYVRNLLLNLLVLVPLMAAVLAIPRFYSLLLRADDPNGQHFRQTSLLMIAIAALFVGFGYIGAARPASHGRSAGVKFMRWANSNGGFVILCILPLVIAATAISLYWGQAAEESGEVLRGDWPWAVGAILMVTVFPCIIYYVRFIHASAIERRESLQRQMKAGSHLAWKLAAEFVAAVLGVVTAGVLLWLLAVKVFDYPLRAVPDLTSIPPYLRVLYSAVPMSELYVCFSIPLILAVFFIQASVFVGISGKVNEDYDREWWGRAGAWLLMAAVFLAAAGAISVFGPVLLYRAPVLLGSIGGVSGIAAGLIGFSAKTPATDKEEEKGGKASALTNIGLGLLVPIFVVLFLAAISLATTWVLQQVHGTGAGPTPQWLAQFQSNATFTETTEPGSGEKFESKLETAKTPFLSIATVDGVRHLQTVHATGRKDVGAIAAIGLGAFLLSFFIGVNRFSMHALYRNRLIRAYLGASRYSRDPDAFTGFDPHDNVQMYEMRPELLWTTSFADVAMFARQLKDNCQTAGSVEQTIWNALDKKTRHWLEDDGPVGDVLTNALIQNVNEILLTLELDADKGSGTYDASPAARLRRNRIKLQATFTDSLRPMPRRSPMHVVNTALNLIAGEKLAWQERKAESFTVSPLHSGSIYVGYRDSKEYGGKDGISLGTAVTISGAAASPNMGYHSSGAMAFLLTILNVRLGSWLGNPGLAGKNTYARKDPRTNLEPLLWELGGKTNDQCPLVYLSDGGHFENLALYEMVLRRCRYIVVSDAGSDAKYTFEDLGNAIRKIRTDLGVPIDIEEMSMFPRSTDGAEFKEGRYVATATIRYSAIDGPDAPPGLLVYLKPGLYRDDYFPRDVYNYAQQSQDFPHESTADQFFSESQFESYRALGRHVINEICGNYAPRDSKRPRLPYAKTYPSVAEFALAVEEKARTMPTTLIQDVITTGVHKLSAAIGALGSHVHPPDPGSGGGGSGSTAT